MYQFERNSQVYSASSSPTNQQNGAGGGGHCDENGGSPTHHNHHHHSTKSLNKDTQHRAVSSELGELQVPGETKTKTQMARAFQQSQELYKSADSKAGLQTVKTRRVLKKTTTITKGENEKAQDLAKQKRIKELLEQILEEIKRTNKRMDKIEGQLVEEEHKIGSLSSLREAEKSQWPDVFRRLCEEMADVGIRIDGIKKLAEEFYDLNGLNEPDSCMVREKIADLEARYKQLLNRLNRLHDEFERTLKRLREMDDADRRAKAMREAEAKLRLMLDEMKRRLDELEYRIDHMDPVAKDLPTLRRQLAEMQEFDKDLRKAKADLHEIKRFAEKLIADKLLADPARARAEIAALEAQLARIEDKANRRLQLLERAVAHAERQKKAEQELELKLDAIRRQIEQLERRMDALEAEPIGKTLPVLKRQIDDLKSLEADVGKTRRNLEDVVRLAEEMIREDLLSDPAKVRKQINELKDRLNKLDERIARRLRLLKEAHDKVQAQKEAEERFRLRLDAIKRELDELERRLDNMAPVGRDLATLQAQLAEMEQFMVDLGKTRNNLTDVIKAGEKLIAEDLIADPEALRKDMKALKDQLKRIEDKAAKRLKEIQDALSALAATDALDAIGKWLEQAKRMLLAEEQVHGDLDTVNALIEQHKSFELELQAKAPALAEAKRMEQQLQQQQASPQTMQLVRDQLQAVNNQWRDVERLTREKSAKLTEALRAAEQMHENVHGLLEFLADAESRLRHSGSPMAEDEQSARQELGEHEKFMRKLQSLAGQKDQTLKLAKDIESRCHPDAEPVVKHWISILGDRWNEIDQLAKLRGQQLAEHLRSLGELLALIEELIQWLGRHETRLLTEETQELPQQVHQLESMISSHSNFMDELRKREPDVDRVVKIFASKSQQATSKTIVTATTTKPRQDATTNSMNSLTSSMGRLSTTPTGQQQQQSRTSYATYRDEYPEVRQARARVLLEKWRSVWQLSLDKMQKIKDKLEQARAAASGQQQLMAEPEKPKSDTELIQEEIQRSISKCKCPQRFRIYHAGDGRYRFGESQKLRQVKVQNSTIVVRSQGSWEQMSSFVNKNDPCKSSQYYR